ncbi:cytochrome C biogenesis protein [Paenibacillus sp. CAA11]|uniref:cytochrome c biogenesis CcdA family protein n=1 Tax=Paenibacillus sp. CAA11 TaxID=1532905 RepID=UPI000D33E1AA|nr:cytochrome c biogenesis protein CcdA [Paenibacillus sp. CAA11]AWB45118.1 cytochrome C biogenesis protein [Paenibacillus sp. CAA11]
MGDLHTGAALTAGFLSFLSPCALPLYPSYLSYITGLSLGKLREEGHSPMIRSKILLHTLAFVAGFSIIFYSLGFGAGIIGEWFTGYRGVVRIIAGGTIFFMGMVSLGLLRPGWIMRERRIGSMWNHAGYFGSFLFGIGFAAGWSPCVGPILAGIIALAAVHPASWFVLITAYAAGFALPFFVMAIYVDSTKWISRHAGWLNKAGGGIMLLIGLALISGRMARLNVWLQQITPDWLVL